MAAPLPASPRPEKRTGGLPPQLQAGDWNQAASAVSPPPSLFSTPQLEGLPDCTARILKRLSWPCELTVLVGPLLLVETHRL
jgi:hypothetical protein